MQDVTSGSPGHRAGLRAYDLITGIDDKRIATNNEIIREVARRESGHARAAAGGARRPDADRLPCGWASGRAGRPPSPKTRARRSVPSSDTPMPLGLSVREIDRATANRLRLPNGVSGVVVTRVDPLSAASDAGIQRDHVVMEINRRPVDSADAYNRLARSAHPGDVLAVYVYMPGSDQRSIRAVRVDAP